MELKDNTLTLKGQRQRETKVKEEQYHRREQVYSMAANSERTHEPLIFVLRFGRRPDTYPTDQQPPLAHRMGWREITAFRLTLPRRDSLSPELQQVQASRLIGLQEGDDYQLEVCFDGGEMGQEVHLTPELHVTL